MPVDEQSRAVFNYMTIRPTIYRLFSLIVDCRVSNRLIIKFKKMISLALF